MSASGSTVEALPRVLLILMPKVRADDAANLLVRAQFASWPKESLAQIHSTEPSGRGEFCGRYHRLGPDDRFLGSIFERMRGSVARMVSMEEVRDAPTPRPAPRTGQWTSRCRRWLGERIVATGLWEVLFPVRSSRRLVEFVEEFRPDVIYCTGYSLAFATLPLLLARRFGVPICFQTMEDWPSYTYAGSPVGILVRREATRLVRASTLRLAFGRKMKVEFEARYGVPFQETWHLDDAERFGPPGPDPAGPVRRVAFTGTMVLNRHEPVADMLAAIRLLRREGIEVEFDVHCTGVPRELPDDVRNAPEVRFLPLPSHEDLGGVLRGADVLFLPEAFSVGADRLGLAISTKCHLYMMAGRPILAYGPAHAGTVEYARKDGWALVVQERSVERLAEALRTLLLEPAVRARLTHQASLCFIRNHDARAARERFERAMAAAAAGRAAVPHHERSEENA